MNRNTLWKTILKWLAGLFGLLILLAAAVFAFFQTQPGRAFFASRLSSMLSSEPERQVAFAAPQGLVPFRLQFDEITVNDAEGQWLGIEDAVLRWSPRELFRGRIWVQELGASVVRVLRSPVGPEEPEQGGIGLPGLPQRLPPIMIERLYVEDLLMEESVAGQRAAFQVEGSIMEPESGPAFMASLRAQRKDEGPETLLDMTAVLHGTPQALDLDAEFHEEAEGWAASTLGLQGADALHVTLQGNGPLTGWTGVLNADMSRLGSVRAEIEMAKREEIWLSLEGRYEAGDWNLSPRLAAMLKEGAVFDSTVRLLPSHFLSMEDLNLQGAGYVLQGSGRLDLESEAMKGTWTVDVNDPVVLESLIGTSLGGRLTMYGTLSGTLNEPETSIQMELGGVQTESSADRVVPKDLVRPAGPAEIFGSVTFVQDVGGLGAFWQDILPGALSVDMDLKADVQARSVFGEIRGRVTRPDQLPPDLRVLLGPDFGFSGRFDLREGNQLQISDFQAGSQVFQLRSQGSANLAERRVQGDWQLSVPDLKPLEPALERSLAGSLAGQGRVEGTFDAMQVVASLEGSDVQLDDIAVEQMTVNLNARDVPQAPRGNAQLQLRREEERLLASTDFSLENQQLALSPLTMEAPGATLGGDLIVHLERNLLEGRLDGRFTDLSSLGRLVDQPLKGSGELQARFSPDEEGQTVDLVFRGEQLAAGFGEVRSLNVTAGLKNALERPYGTVEAALEDFQRPGLVLNTLRFNASGGPEALSFEGRAAGHATEEVELQTRGALMRSETAEQVRIDALSGRFGDYPLQLVQPPATLHRTPEGYSVDRLALGFGPGQVRLSGRFDPSQVNVDIDLERFPLEVLAIFGGPELSGSAGGRIRLQGDPSEPQIDMNLVFSELQAPTPALGDISDAALTIAARLERGRLRTEAELQRVVERPIRATLTVPVEFSLVPFSFSLPPQGALQGRVEGEADLVTLAALLPPGDHEFSGRLTVRVEIGGIVSDPAISGQANVERGSYQNLTAGTVLQNLTAEVRATSDRVTVERLTATDGGQGRFSGTGWVNIDPANDFPLNLDLTLTRFTAVRQPGATGSADANLRLTGSMRAMELAGDVTVRSAEFNLDAQLPPRVPEIEVIEIHASGKTVQAEEEFHDTERGETALPFSFNTNVRVAIPGNASARGRGLESQWRGNLEVTGPVQDPVVAGDLTVVRGRFDFLGRRFNLETGVVRFFGTRPVTPVLDIIAEATARDITARLVLSGPLASLAIRLESDPPLPQDEILARVLFNREMTSLTPFQALRLADALRTLSGRGHAFDLIGRTREFFGLEQLEIRPLEEDSFGVGIGRYLTEEVYVDVEKGPGTESGRMSVTVEVTPNITVESQTGLDADHGIGVNWKYDY